MSDNTQDTTQSQRVDTIRDNYFEALENQDTDLAAASSDAQRTMINANVSAARLRYWEAKAKDLSATGDAVEAAHEAAKEANAAVKKAREQSEAIPKILKLAIQATDAAGDLLEAAAKK